MVSSRCFIHSGIAIILLMIVMYYSLIKTSRIDEDREPKFPLKDSSNILDNLDGCYHVFHVGIQTRKLFEPELYTGQSKSMKMLQVFESQFNHKDQRSNLEICSVGFEPNFLHTKELKELQKVLIKL